MKMRKTMNNTEKQQPLPVAEVKPGDFPLVSIESRAEARMIAEKIANRHKLVRRIVFVPTGLDEAKRKSLAGACCFRRVEGADEITEFWHWEN